MHLRKKINSELSQLIHQLEEEAREEKKPSSRVLLYSAIGKIVEAGRLIHDSFTEEHSTKKYRGRLTPAEEGIIAARAEYRARLRKENE